LVGLDAISYTDTLKLFKHRSIVVERAGFPIDAKDAIQALGIDGMSSEDSEGEVGRSDRKFFIKQLPWRHLELTRWLHQLDTLPPPSAQPLGTRSYITRIRTRQKGNSFSLTRRPPKGLSQAYFDLDWLKNNMPSNSPGLLSTIHTPWAGYLALLGPKNHEDVMYHSS
jgi:hypothetical protein